MMSSDEPGYHNCKAVLATNICNLLCSLGPSTYDKIAPKIEYWIEYSLTEQFTTIDDLAERVSSVAWREHSPRSHISRFLKEFREGSHCSEQARSFIDKLCFHILRWFAVASAEDLLADSSKALVSKGGGYGFLRAASFVGLLIRHDLLSRELVRRHLSKPLTTHHYNDDNVAKQAVRAKAIYNLFTLAEYTLLQGFLEPEDVQVCFEILETGISLVEAEGLRAFDAERLNGFREIHAAWLLKKEEEEQRNATAAEVSATEVETPVAFVPQDLPTAHTGVDSPSSILRAIVAPSIPKDVEYPSKSFIDIPATAVSSPTLSISTISDLTPTELGEDVDESDGGEMITHHDTFYFEDGNVEIMCGHTLFRVHSTTISFSSPKLLEILSRPALLHAPTPEGCPRITVTDTAQDFAVLLKMIYTPGFPAWRKVPEFAVFASLLRMTTKYGFSDVREQLVDSIKGAYPTKWEDPRTGKILGEAVFGSPKPHPNAVLNLFTEQRIKFALPFAAYRAALGGFSSLTSDKLGTVLPPLTLASTIYGMEVIRSGLANLAHSVVCSMSLGVCRDEACVANVGLDPPERRMEVLNKIYGVMVKEGKGDVLFSHSFGNIVCANCAKTPEQAYHLWCGKMWEELPRIFGVGGGWEEV